MSLTRSLDVARSHLSATAEYMNTVSRNVARAGEAGATRKVSQYVTNSIGGVLVSTPVRSENELLFAKTILSTSNAGRDRVLVDGLAQLGNVVGDPELESSPAALIQKLEQSLQFYSEGAHDLTRANDVMLVARALADGSRTASPDIQTVRQDADTDIANSVIKINDLLTRLEPLNDEIVRGTQTGRDVTDQLDERDRIVKQLSEEFGIRTELRENNDLAIRTDGGVTIFDKKAKLLSFQATGGISATTTASPILVDGIPITGPNAIMPITTGRLAGLIQIRDVSAVQFQRQLDEVARGLIESFAETDQVGGGNPPAAGLFTYLGGPAVPATGTHVPGIASTIAVHPSVLADPTLIRDGGINGAAYLYNSTGAAGYNSRILEFGDQLAANRAFDPAAGLDATTNVLQFAANSDGWLSAQREIAQDHYDYSSVVYETAADRLDRVTGINVEEEYLVMLELERAYQASSKLIATVDEMFDSLLAAAR